MGRFGGATPGPVTADSIVHPRRPRGTKSSVFSPEVRHQNPQKPRVSEVKGVASGSKAPGVGRARPAAGSRIALFDRRQARETG